MKLPETRKFKQSTQHLICVGFVLLVSTACFFTAQLFGYKVIALFLLMTVSMLAMLFDILPVLIAAILSALIWNFFFIPPVYTFHIDTAEDVLMFFLYFLIALVNTVLTFKIRQQEQQARDKEEKEKTIKLYNTLLNSLSHELRTPISTIIGAIDTLKENNDKLSAPNRDELLQQIDFASIRLNQQVENLLNMSRLESGMLKPNLDWCDVTELVSTVLQKLRSTSGNHTLLFNSNEQLPLFKLDGGLLEQVLYNILHNAILYTPKGSIIRIETLYQNERLVLNLSDNGLGFPEREIPLVFDKFYRLPHTKTGGSGLGLSIAKGFIEAQHGTIVLQNQQKGGALFTITIPAETTFINNLKNE